VWTYNNRLTVVDVGFEVIEPVRAGAFETFQTQRAAARKRTGGEFIRL
jgi:hypothetical protein